VISRKSWIIPPKPVKRGRVGRHCKEMRDEGQGHKEERRKGGSGTGGEGSFGRALLGFAQGPLQGRLHHINDGTNAPWKK